MLLNDLPEFTSYVDDAEAETDALNLAIQTAKADPSEANAKALYTACDEFTERAADLREQADSMDAHVAEWHELPQFVLLGAERFPGSYSAEDIGKAKLELGLEL